MTFRVGDEVLYSYIPYGSDKIHSQYIGIIDKIEGNRLYGLWQKVGGQLSPSSGFAYVKNCELLHKPLEYHPDQQPDGEDDL